MTPDPAAAGDRRTDEVVERLPSAPPAHHRSDGLDLKNRVLPPLMVNLVTAGIIGLWVWLFSANIRRWFFPPSRAADWPIYCVLEPVVNPSPAALVQADLYIVNLEGQKHDGRSLGERAQDSGTDPAMRPPTAITVEMSGSSHRLIGIEPDLAFNEGKGRLAASSDGGAQRWTVKVDEIESGAILRARVRTDVRRPITAKTDVETMPLKVLYARDR